MCGAFFMKKFAHFTTFLAYDSIVELKENGPWGFSTRASHFIDEENDTRGGKVTTDSHS